ncbi:MULTISPECIES: hypothetical protein [unclassified Paenibacillus]|uniref:hypothetical protein n=1 Tax=unclassified Paenibacillus TaxID=185978 RepID=UPI002785A996|nr:MULTISPECIES: hypothetical protein [unclassified Paenibacillus]MDQ0896232.1 hypothetical protein [Paenibacillus sp. V4I7]MDQ0913953.1 hypothetical protein [Paenibacillus sp. V4I5]
MRQLYDRHYSRPKASIGKAQFKRPGYNLTMRTKEGDMLDFVAFKISKEGRIRGI